MKAVIDHKCPGCGTKIIYNIKTNKWDCSSCNMSYTLEDLQKFDGNAASIEANKEDEHIKIDVYKCPDCGAEIITDENTASTSCVYCGNTSIIRNRLVGEYAPELIIPFKTTKEDFYEKFKTLLLGRPMLDKTYFNNIEIENIKGIYLPYFLFDIKYIGQVDYTYVRKYTYNDTTYAEIVARDIPYDGSKYLDDDIMMNIFPYDFNESKKYNHGYLSGFLAERYDERKENLKERMLEKFENSLGLYIKSQNKRNVKKVDSSKMKKEISDPKYVLLPVWIVKVKGNESYFAMNGQTKEIIGHIPLDKIKCFFLYAAVLVASLYLSYLYINGSNDIDPRVFVFLIGLPLILSKRYINSNKIVKKCNTLEIFIDNVETKLK